MNYNPSPKSQLLKDTLSVDQHHTLVQSETLHNNLKLALMEMQRRAADQIPADNFNACASAHLRMLGAQELIDIFLNLAEAPLASVRSDNTNLPSNVRTMPGRK